LSQIGCNTKAKTQRPRSAVSRGRKVFLPDAISELVADGRSVTARRYVDLMHEFIGDQGDRLSEGRRQLARRAALLAVQLEMAETRFVATEGDAFESDQYIAAARELRQLIATMGLDRVPKDVGGSRAPQPGDALRRIVESADAR
jgi:hypothetical protein